MRSMFTGVSGLKTHQQKMDVIANNIANVNTVAYKSSRTTFNEFFSQTVSSASGANEQSGRGGTNPMQVGLGVSLGSIDIDMTTGAAQRTNRPMDLMISGEGFFMVGDNSGTFFTRDGNFSIDPQGNIVNSAGLRVLGWDVTESLDENGNPTGQFEPVQDIARPIQISGDKTYSPPSATDTIKYTGNLNSTDTPEHISSISFYDSVGNNWSQDVKMTWSEADQQWNVSLKNVAYLNGDRENPYKVENITANGTEGPDIENDMPVMEGNWSSEINGLVKEDAAFEESWVTVDPLKFTNQGLSDGNNAIGLTNYTVTGTAIKQNAFFGDGRMDADGVYQSGEMVIDFTDLTMFGNEVANGSAETITGNEPGTLVGMSVTGDGSIVGQYGNGLTKVIGKIPVAVFANPAGLEKMGGNLFRTTLNSGGFDGIGDDIATGGGSMLGGALEMSNVDLSSEFTEMITTQRGFQANSRTITTSDEIIQELVNLKR